MKEKLEKNEITKKLLQFHDDILLFEQLLLSNKSNMLIDHKTQELLVPVLEKCLETRQSVQRQLGSEIISMTKEKAVCPIIEKVKVKQILPTDLKKSFHGNPDELG